MAELRRAAAVSDVIHDQKEENRREQQEHAHDELPPDLVVLVRTFQHEGGDEVARERFHLVSNGDEDERRENDVQHRKV